MLCWTKISMHSVLIAIQKVLLPFLDSSQVSSSSVTTRTNTQVLVLLRSFYIQTKKLITREIIRALTYASSFQMLYNFINCLLEKFLETFQACPLLQPKRKNNCKVNKFESLWIKYAMWQYIKKVNYIEIDNVVFSLTSSWTSRVAVSCGSSPFSIPPAGTTHLSGFLRLDTRRT